MKKNRTVKKTLSALICAGLLLSSLPATLPVRAQGPIVQPVATKVSKKLSPKKISEKLRSIKKTIRILQAVNIVVPILIGAAGGVAFITAAGVTLGVTPRLIQQINWEYLKKPRKSMALKAREVIENIQWARLLPGFIAAVIFAKTTIVTIVSALGFSGITMGIAFGRLRELELMEKDHPGTLTKNQKLTIVQLKNMAKGPVVRGIMKMFSLKDAQNEAVATLLKKNLMLVSFGEPKKVRKIIGRYIKLKWIEQNAKSGVTQMAKEKMTPEQQKNYKKAMKDLQKKEQQVKDLEKKHPILATTPEVKDALQTFKQKADNIIEALKKPMVIEEEKPTSQVVPL